MSLTLVGTVAAQSSQITELQDPDVRDITEGEDTLEVYVEVKFSDRNKENEDLISINVQELAESGVSITGISDVSTPDSGSGDLNVGSDASNDTEEIGDAEGSDVEDFDTVDEGDRIALVAVEAVGSGAEEFRRLKVTLNVDASSANDPEKITYDVESRDGNMLNDSSILLDGDGSEDKPHKIFDWAGLDAVSDHSDDSFELSNDLNESTEGYDTYASSGADGGEGWDPVDDFYGTFDGQGHTIDDLFINREGDNNGLFGTIKGTGQVRNLGVTNVDLTGDQMMGGLAGRNNGLIKNSFTTGMVDGRDRTGGLVGFNEGEINNSYTGTEVISGGDMVGGLVGDNGDTIQKSYSFGLVDEAGESGKVGGLTGREDGDTWTDDSFWDTETSGQSSSGGGTGLTTAQMQDYNSFTDESNDGLDAAWDFVGTENDDAGTDEYWEMDQDGTVNDNYPILTWQDGADGTLTYTFSGGSGTEDDPYEISNWGDHPSLVKPHTSVV